jgi:UDP-N-acetyl-D-galactosamine dehydrogenase
MARKGISLPDAKILIMGVTFKEDCPDVRNTKVVDVITELQEFGAKVEVYDPWADPDIVREEYGIEIVTEQPADGRYAGIVLAVAHRQFTEMSMASIHALGAPDHIVYDIKSVLPADQIDARL